MTPDTVVPEGLSAAAVNAAVALAVPQNRRVLLPPGYAEWTEPVVVTDGPYASHAVSFEGSGMQATQIVWKGDPNAAALKINKNKQHHGGRISISNGGPKGQSRGILFTGPGGGTQSGSATWDDIILSGFHRNLQIGEDGGHAASEIVFRNLLSYQANAGVYVKDYNSLVLKFDLLSTGGCGVGLHVDSGSVSVVGGSSGHNGMDFWFVPAGSFAVQDYRSEGSGVFLATSGTAAATMTRLSNCEVRAVTGPHSIFGPGAGILTVDHCRLDKPIGATLNTNNGGRGTLVVRSSTILDSEPFRSRYDPSTINGLRYHVEDSQQIDAQGSFVKHFDTEIGVVQNGARVPAWKVAA